MKRVICRACGREASYPVRVGMAVYHIECAPRQGTEVRVPEWLRRSKEQPNGLARDLTGAV